MPDHPFAGAGVRWGRGVEELVIHLSKKPGHISSSLSNTLDFADCIYGKSVIRSTDMTILILILSMSVSE